MPKPMQERHPQTQREPDILNLKFKLWGGGVTLGVVTERYHNFLVEKAPNKQKAHIIVFMLTDFTIERPAGHSHSNHHA